VPACGCFAVSSVSGHDSPVQLMDSYLAHLCFIPTITGMSHWQQQDGHLTEVAVTQ